MKTTLLSLALFAAATLQAAPLIQFDPSTGADISAPAGGSPGWAVRVTPDPTDWVSFTFTALVSEDNPIGIYTDLLASFGGPVNFLFPPGGAESGPYDLGVYAIDPAAAPGSVNHVTIRLGYDTFDGDPSTCSDCSYLSSGTIDLDGSVSVPSESSAPEPATWIMLLFSLAVFAGHRLWRNLSSPKSAT